MTDKILADELAGKSWDRLNTAMKVLKRRPSTQNIQEALLLVGGAKLVLEAAAEFVTDE